MELSFSAISASPAVEMFSLPVTKLGIQAMREDPNKL